MTGFKIHDFGYGAQFRSYTEAYKAQKKYVCLNDVFNAIGNYSIPVTFDGEVPEYAFGDTERRFNIGDRVEVSKGTFMTLSAGVVNENAKQAMLCLLGENMNMHFVTIKLSEAEISAYRSHPETFFGRITQVSKKSADSPFDLYSFFIESHQQAPKEVLLKQMEKAPDFEELKQLPEEDLRYIHAERMVHSVTNRKE